MNIVDFRTQLSAWLTETLLATKDGDWIIKGFIDVYRNIYTVSLDTKVLSKIVELMLFPTITRFAREHSYHIILSEHQNHYPDITFIAPDQSKVALDVKSTYRTSDTTVSGFTLGSFTGYFRQRNSSKNATVPYNTYNAHLVLGIIYSRNEAAVDEGVIYHLEDLPLITSVIRDFRFLLQEKWRIASDKPGSGNTKNIGSIREISDLIEGRHFYSTRCRRF